jgi:NIMA (never in mitosis gene a)-related kinase
MEYCDGGDLYMIVKKHSLEKKYINEDQIWGWFYQLCQAIKYIHSKKIIHRDIKTQNIFLNKKGQVCIFIKTIGQTRRLRY